ncbi:MAG: folylpolyglutamate synthase/dihydrofolate synthase family protein [Acidimicrobiia bacterium]|nr:MAG: folylpolyglutamate synthase/dihydrofolate synthase family protein [Acidimicrobiia bacterium]
MATTESAPTIRTRDEAEAFLNDRIGYGVQPGLERISGLLEFMGSPQVAYPSIHIAGTNGKTTVSRMVQQILGAHGLATGGFTSPHLSTVEERFTLHGVTLDSLDFIDAVADIAWFVEAYEQQADTHITYFEVTAALAFSIFGAAVVDVAVVEVGLGGRLDATNVLNSSVAVITGVDIDHTEFLGSRIEQIAAEKAAIVGLDGTLVTGPLQSAVEGVVADRVRDTQANWIRFYSDFGVTEAIVAVGGHHVSIDGVFGRYEDLYLPIHGRHQVDHLATAIAASEMFLARELDRDSLSVAVGSMTAPGRLEVVGHRPLVVLDGAHNVQGFRGLASTLENEFPAIEWQLVLGVRGLRDVNELVAPLKGLIGKVYATAPSDAAAIDPESVAIAAGAALDVEAVSVDRVTDALAMAADAGGADGGVVVAGSLYLVGEARRQFSSPVDRTLDAHLRFEAERFDDEEHDPYDETDPLH